jgi:hypothetical protein
MRTTGFRTALLAVVAAALLAGGPALSYAEEGVSPLSGVVGIGSAQTAWECPTTRSAAASDCLASHATQPEPVSLAMSRAAGASGHLPDLQDESGALLEELIKTGPAR